MGGFADPWPELLADLCVRAGADSALAVATQPPRRLAGIGVLPADLGDPGAPEGVSAALARSGFAHHLVRAYARPGEKPLGLIALASRAGPVDPAPLDAGAEMLLLRFALERESAARARLESRLIDMERLATLGTVACAVAHDLAAPISALTMEGKEIQNRVEDLRQMLRDAGPVLSGVIDDLDHLAEGCFEAADRARALLIDFRLAARPSDAGANQRGMVSIGDALRSCVRMAGPLARHAVRLELIVDPSLPAVPGVRRRLEQAFTNLLVNAIHAASVREAGAGLVELRTSVIDGEVVVEIVDNGPGIAPDVLERIFDPFFTTKPKEQGTGLGLPITREIVEAHGGRIEVHSDRGRGATFRVRLPVATFRPGLKDRPRILVVDDDEGVAKAYLRALGDGFDVTVAIGGRAALRVLERGAVFDALVVDLHMPEIDGPALFAAVQQKWPGLEKKIVFASGGAYTQACKSFLERVPNRCLNKPIDGAELQPLLRSLVDAA